MTKIILASMSPRRKELLEKLGLEFSVVESPYEEDMTLDMPPQVLAAHLAKGKAAALTDQYEDAIIIAADTIVVAPDGTPMGKPHTIENAKKMLQKIVGNHHDVMTGMAVIHTKTKKEHIATYSAKVHMLPLSEEEIDRYIMDETLLDKAGAYGIQGLAAAFIEKIEGDFYTIMGLPLCALTQVLKEYGVRVL